MPSRFASGALLRQAPTYRHQVGACPIVKVAMLEVAMSKMPATLKVGTGLSYWRRRHDPPLEAQEVAMLLGISRSTFSLIEQGRLTPSRATLEELVRILGVPPGALFVPEILEVVLAHG